MAENSEAEDFSLPAKYATIHLDALNRGVRKKISLYLNLPGSLNDDLGLMNDYSGLAEMIGFSYIEIKNFELQKSPTEQVLDEWATRPEMSPTVGNLWKYLKELERVDVLTDSWNFIERDCENHLKLKARFQPKEEPLQDETVTQSSDADMNVDDSAVMSVDDVHGGTPTIYDAFVCYNPEEEDLAFVRELIEKIENQHGLKLFIPWRDDLPGASHNTVCAKLIEQRCKRMIVVLSKKFLQSASCDFQTKFAFSLSPGARSKKMIPILIENCEIPHILRHITCCNYTKKELIEWFWGRLASSLKAPLDPSDRAIVNSQQLSSISLDTSMRISDWSYSSSSSNSLSMSSLDSGSASSMSSTSSASSLPLYPRGGSTSASTSIDKSSKSSGDYEKIGNLRRLRDKLTGHSSRSKRPPPPPRDVKRQGNSQEEHFC